jgi:glutaredoxin
MKLTLLYFDGCPSWQTAEARLHEALAAVGLEDQEVELELVSSQEDAERLGFRGSPTILIDGADPFANESVPLGLSCRLYQTEKGLEGAPSAAQLGELLRRASR